jgi:hypothetical protein
MGSNCVKEEFGEAKDQTLSFSRPSILGGVGARVATIDFPEDAAIACTKTTGRRIRSVSHKLNGFTADSPTNSWVLANICYRVTFWELNSNKNRSFWQDCPKTAPP